MLTTIENVLAEKGYGVVALPATATVHEAIQTMAHERIESLVVLDDDRLVGILTERDCARRVTLQSTDPKTVRVKDVMTSPVTFVSQKHTVGDCLAILSEGGFAHLPVMDGERLVGIVSMGDLVNSIVRDQGRVINNLEGYITGKYPG